MKTYLAILSVSLVLTSCGPSFDELTWTERKQADFGRAKAAAEEACAAELYASWEESAARDAQRQADYGGQGLVIYPSDRLLFCTNTRSELGEAIDLLDDFDPFCLEGAPESNYSRPSGC